MAQPKEYKGVIVNWAKVPVEGHGLGYRICGDSVDHPVWRGGSMFTSYVVAHNEETGMIETLNSCYRLMFPVKEK